MKHGIKFIEKDVSVDHSAVMEMKQLGFMGVPSFKIGDVAFSGLDFNRILAEIDYQVISCPSCQKKLRAPKEAEKLKITCPACQNSFKIATK